MRTPEQQQLFTIGFTRKSAEQFFETLRNAGVKRIIDVRLNKTSQLAAFSKRDDLRYFLEKLLGIEYVEEPLFAPTQQMLDRYRKEQGSWIEYERAFVDLLQQREVEKVVDPQVVSGACLLCSEDTPHQCHRRLVADYLERAWGGIEIRHL